MCVVVSRLELHLKCLTPSLVSCMISHNKLSCEETSLTLCLSISSFILMFMTNNCALVLSMLMTRQKFRYTYSFLIVKALKLSHTKKGIIEDTVTKNVTQIKAILQFDFFSRHSLDVSFDNSLNKHHEVRPGMLLGGSKGVLMYAGYSISTPNCPDNKKIKVYWPPIKQKVE